jgi:hypothetical protein
MATTPFKILGIYREEKYSNRAVDVDRAILDAVLYEFEKITGTEVVIERVKPEWGIGDLYFKQFHLVFSMAQSEEFLTLLECFENRGATVVNSATGIRNCYRHKLSEILDGNVFSYPKFSMVNMKTQFSLPEIRGGHWLKRGDFHALSDDDVVYVETEHELQKNLSQFQMKGVDSIIMQENCEGELFKFYGVCDHFFNIRYIGRTDKDRYATHAGNPDIQFDREHLKNLAHSAAQVLGLDFYGGDCIVSSTGRIHLIDFNDWPSFRTCRDEVAPIMAQYALQKFKSEVSLDRFTLSGIQEQY